MKHEAYYVRQISAKLIKIIYIFVLWKIRPACSCMQLSKGLFMLSDLNLLDLAVGVSN